MLKTGFYLHTYAYPGFAKEDLQVSNVYLKSSSEQQVSCQKKKKIFSVFTAGESLAIELRSHFTALPLPLLCYQFIL